MDGPEGHDRFVENSIVLRRLKDVKATWLHEKERSSGASAQGIETVPIASSATMKPPNRAF
jgi:hypothetical protein